MKWWFGRKAGREGVRPFLFRWGQGVAHAAVGEWPRSYEAQVRDAYLGNPVAQRAVRLVAESAASAVLYADQSGTLAREEAGKRTISLLPPRLIETVVTNLLLHGNAYVQILCDADGVPAELFALRPERVSVEADAGGWPRRICTRRARRRAGSRRATGLAGRGWCT
jgi:phage portal protein BeeE